MRRRLDAELVRRRLVSDPAAARAVIGEGQVLVDGIPAAGPATMVGTDQAVVISTPSATTFVSRGGQKLDAAFERFSLDPTGSDALDAGASTGGFTDCLLRRGASRVVAVDVGYGDLAWALRTDPRVTVLERTNIRTLDRAALPFIPSFVVADLSFVSLGSVVGTLARLAARDATFVVLVKPQFEASRNQVEAGGVIRDPRVWMLAIERVVDALSATGIEPRQVCPSPLLGPAGNVEFLLWGRAGAAGSGTGIAIDDAIVEARAGLGGSAS